MQTVRMVLTLLLAVTASGFLSRLLPFKLPLPLVQIAIGAVISFAAGFDIILDPGIFFLLFIPPLLFLDGWRIPKGAFFRELRPILTLVIGLVIFTVIGVGFLIHWLIPSMPLAVAFALAAILSPTDPVAVSAISARAPIPPRLMRILEGESLLNDASGLVCFRLALAAVLTGAFSLTAASLDFVRLAGGGVAVGIAVAWGISLANRLLVRKAGEEPDIQILVSLLMPFAAYLLAEHLDVSGVLAAATAGITMHYADLAGRPLATTRMQRRMVWDTVQTILNGMVFMLLGQQLPRILTNAPDIARNAGIDGAWHLGAYAACITLALIVLRLVWVLASLRLTLFRDRHPRSMNPRSFLRTASVTAFAGVKGTITLAGILTLPLAMINGAPFPARDLAIFLAMGVILLSLFMASVALPLLTAGIELPAHTAYSDTEVEARNATAEAAIRRIEQVRSRSSQDASEARLLPETAGRILDMYHRRLEHGHAAGDRAEHERQLAEAERQLHIEALRAERDELYRLLAAHQIDDAIHRQLLHEIDWMENALSRQKTY